MLFDSARLSYHPAEFTIAALDSDNLGLEFKTYQQNSSGISQSVVQKQAHVILSRELLSQSGPTLTGITDFGPLPSNFSSESVIVPIVVSSANTSEDLPQGPFSASTPGYAVMSYGQNTYRRWILVVHEQDGTVRIFPLDDLTVKRTNFARLPLIVLGIPFTVVADVGIGLATGVALLFGAEPHIVGF